MLGRGKYREAGYGKQIDEKGAGAKPGRAGRVSPRSSDCGSEHRVFIAKQAN